MPLINATIPRECFVTWVLPHEAGVGSKVLPAERGVPVVVVHKNPVQTLGPLDGVDHLRIAVKHVCRDVYRAHVGVDRDAGEVLVVLQVDPVRKQTSK